MTRPIDPVSSLCRPIVSLCNLVAALLLAAIPSCSPKVTDSSGAIRSARPIEAQAAPDLRSNPSITTTVSPTVVAGVGDSVQVDGAVFNAGNGSSGAFRIGIYASPDIAISTSDIRLGYHDMANLAAGASAAFQVTVGTTDLLPQSSYQIGWIADPDGTVAESNESNNGAYLAINGPIYIGPAQRADLVTTTEGSSLSSYSLSQPGEPLSVTCLIRNMGNAPSGSYSVSFYASLGPDITTSDTLLGNMLASSIAGGSSATLTLANANTNLLAHGQAYYVGWIVDPGNVVLEYSEANNIASAQNQLNLNLQALPDLRTQTQNSSFAPAIIASAGVPVSVTCEIFNAGVAPSPISAVNFYASVDSVITADDALMGTQTIGGLAPGARTNCTLASGATASLTAGLTYYIGWIVDPDGAVSESNETNNRAVAAGGLVVASSGSTLSWIRETPHPYANLSTYTATYSHLGATQVGVHFAELLTEDQFDYITIKNAQGAIVYRASGDLIGGGSAVFGAVFGRFDGWCFVSGSSITIELETDFSVVDYGFRTDFARWLL